MSVERQVIFWVLVLGAFGYALNLLGSTVAPFAAGIALGYLRTRWSAKWRSSGSIVWARR